MQLDVQTFPKNVLEFDVHICASSETWLEGADSQEILHLLD